MNLLRTYSISKKEFIHIFRDPRSLLMGIAIPMLMLLLFGYALSLDVDDIPFIVIDEDNSPASREFVAAFDGSPYFTLIGRAENYGQVERSIDMGQAMMALVIQPGFEGDLSGSTTARVHMLVDGSDSRTATIAISYAEAISMMQSAKISASIRAKSGTANLNLPVDLKMRVWYNSDMQSRNYIIPGLIAVLMMVIAALLTSLTIAREWETGTMEQLISTPVKRLELIVGKLTPYFCIGLLDVIIAMFMAKYLFDTPLRGNPAIVLCASGVFLFGALSLGILISVVAKAQLLATQFALITTFLPAFLLSGFMFDISNMPRVIQIVTHIVPARYLITILRAVYMKGVGIELVLVEAVFLTAFGLIVFTIANLAFKKRLT